MAYLGLVPSEHSSGSTVRRAGLPRQAMRKQAQGIDQINIALTQMDEATQQNSALVEQNAATAKMLELQAKAMDDCVAFFKLGGTEDNDRAASASRPGTVVPMPSRAAAAAR